ncbi:MAG: helix-turn-helix domain-containing protein [Myxococcaceae bacterium]
MDLVEFGRYLAQQRELRGLSREDVSRVTKIPLTLVGALETGQAERLPARVFVVNYIRAYATVIGLSPEEALLRFEEIDRTERGEPPPAALERVRRKKALFTLAGVVTALVVAAYALAALSGRVPLPWLAR